jgi:hypothetical protein
MKTMVLAAAALMGATILAANLFATATNAAPVMPKYTGAAILRLADDGRKECDDEAVKACTTRCKGRDASCFPTCRSEMFNMCWGGG